MPASPQTRSQSPPAQPWHPIRRIQTVRTRTQMLKEKVNARVWVLCRLRCCKKRLRHLQLEAEVEMSKLRHHTRMQVMCPWFYLDCPGMDRWTVSSHHTFAFLVSPHTEPF